MAKPDSISLHKFTASVQAAVKAAVAKHPKFELPEPKAIALGYLIRGIPVPDGILSKVTLGETQAFAADVAAHIAQAHPEGLGMERHTVLAGAVLSLGRHVILGIPVPPDIAFFEP